MKIPNQYFVQNKTIFIEPEYNEILSAQILEILSNCNSIIFYDGAKHLDLKFNQFMESRFNRPINNLPNSIKTLKFGFSFDQSVDNLPNSIENLTFGYRFNQPVRNLPNSIKDLRFGIEFNESLDDLPFSIVRLTIANK